MTGDLAAAGMASAVSNSPAAPRIILNQNGQKLGKKGQLTRERILEAARKVMADGENEALTLSAIAREAGLGMTSLYVYFNDLTELLLALFEPVMADADAMYMGKLALVWPDSTLEADCLEFATNYFNFWSKHTQLLHLRHSMAEAGSRRMVKHRVESAQPMVSLIAAQMEHDPGEHRTPALGMATVLFMGLDRMVAVTTHQVLPHVVEGRFRPHVENYLNAEARLFYHGIMDYRRIARGEV
jgi:AcrR family transcriptional regulator